MTWKSLFAFNILLLPGEIGFVILVMLFGDSTVSDGTIHWAALGAITACLVTFNVFLTAFASEPPTSPDEPDDEPKFTQADLNKLIAEERERYRR